MYHAFQRMESNDSTSPRAMSTTFRSLLRFTNTVLAFLGAAMLLYAGYMFLSFESPARPAPKGPVNPWFILAFGGVGLFALITGSCGVVGVITNRRLLLQTYVFLAIALLLVEALALVATFAKASWQKHLPHDETGQATRIWHFVRRWMLVCEWTGCIILALQVLSVWLSCALSAAQQRELMDASDEDDAAWGRRRPLLAVSTSADSLGSNAAARNDPWTQRLREKYGLDAAAFRSGPDAPTTSQLAMEEQAERSRRSRSSCVIM